MWCISQTGHQLTGGRDMANVSGRLALWRVWWGRVEPVAAVAVNASRSEEGASRVLYHITYTETPGTRGFSLIIRWIAPTAMYSTFPLPSTNTRTLNMQCESSTARIHLRVPHYTQNTGVSGLYTTYILYLYMTRQIVWARVGRLGNEKLLIPSLIW